jgi:uncharacterized protein (TIGR02391 family)
MPRRRAVASTLTAPTLRPEQAVSLLRTQLERGQQLLGAERFLETDHEVWENTTRAYLTRAFASDSLNVNHFMEPSYNRQDYPNEDWGVASRRAMTKQIARLQGCIDQLEAVNASGPFFRRRSEGDVDQQFTDDQPASWEDLLHDSVRRNALQQYGGGHWRDAVLNAFIAVFDLVRHRTELDLDGEALITRAFSIDRPLLTVADLTTESGRNDQVGFMMVLQGVFRGVRNPKAHSLQHDLTETKAAQYLVLASLLARRIDEAQRVK